MMNSRQTSRPPTTVSSHSTVGPGRSRHPPPRIGSSSAVQATFCHAAVPSRNRKGAASTSAPGSGVIGFAR